jgi:deoxyribodipyrimidine photolyase-related protein
MKKMSNYAGGDWQQVWDGLFWRIIHKHFFFKGIPELQCLNIPLTECKMRKDKRT